ncbi:MAG: BTAD domain-containing putative transcriptional regulator [Candidatus Promineifilaceae bacterium]
MALLQVQVLGKLRLRHDETTIDRFPTRRVEELLAFLLLHREREHTREQLIDLLWTGHPPTNGRASLSTALWRLGGVFRGLGVSPENILSSSRDWISLTPAQHLLVDATEFETYLNEADNESEPDRRFDHLRKAVGVYKGVFCEGIYAEWCLIERERLERRYLWALGVLMADLIQKRAYEEAISFGKDIVEQDPLREEVHRALMLCFWKAGDSARGIRQFQLCARLVQEELGILPLPETIDLYRRIVDDRVNATFERPPRSDHFKQLKAAYDNFQSAAADLESLLTADEDSSNPPDDSHKPS